MAMFATKRLSKELQKLQGHLPPGVTLVKADDFKEWLMDIRVLDPNPLYENEVYRLKFTFSKNYPIGKINPANLSTSNH
jgi:ubiquitin-conjugating enzyme E2 W